MTFTEEEIKDFAGLGSHFPYVPKLAKEIQRLMAENEQLKACTEEYEALEEEKQQLEDEVGQLEKIVNAMFPMVSQIASRPGIHFFSDANDVLFQIRQIRQAYAKPAMKIAGEEPCVWCGKKPGPKSYHHYACPKRHSNPDILAACEKSLVEYEEGREVMAALYEGFTASGATHDLSLAQGLSCALAKLRKHGFCVVKQPAPTKG
jgi:cell division protein FtsB